MISQGPIFDIDGWRFMPDRANATKENPTTAMTIRSKAVIKGIEVQIIGWPFPHQRRLPMLTVPDFCKVGLNQHSDAHLKTIRILA